MRGCTVRALLAGMRRFRDDEQGATAIEYGLIASGVGMAIISTVFTVGSNLQSNWYNRIANVFN
jgi:pilus assembly protein Flp/PilA